MAAVNLVIRASEPDRVKIDGFEVMSYSNVTRSMATKLYHF